MRRLPHLALCLVACSRAPAPPPAADAGEKTLPEIPKLAEAEPNDSPDQAQKISSSAVVGGQLAAVQPGSKADEDWYALAPAQPADALVSMMPPFPPRVHVELYDRDRNKLKAMTLAGDVEPQQTVPLAQVRVRDQLYVRVSGATGHYALFVNFTPPDPNAEAEPNDRAVDATPLPFDHPLRGTYGGESDKDFYLVMLADAGAEPSPTSDAGAPPAPLATSDGGAPNAAAPPDAGSPAPTEMLRIEVSAVPDVRHGLTLLDDSQAPLASFEGREPGAPLSVRDFPLRPGMTKVYLILESAPYHHKHPGSNQPYTVSVHREPAPADLELEPNDTLPLATPVSLSLSPGSGTTLGTRVGYLAPEGDVDDYRIHLDAPARVHVLLSALDRVDTELSVVDPDPAQAERGKVLMKVNEGGAKEPEVIPALALGAGDHFIRVQAAAHQVGSKWVRDQQDPDQTYKLDVSVLPDEGNFEHEPNDTAAAATPVQPGQTISGYAFPAKDVDVFKLDLSAQPVPAGVTLNLTGVPKVSLTLELRDGAGAKLGELLNSSDPERAGAPSEIHQKLDPGVYFLVVKPHPQSKATGVPQSDADVPYQLSVMME